jgi:hypothetical protein
MSAEIPDGAVLVARAILNSSLWTMRPQDCKVAITCIALANSKDEVWFDGKRDVVIKRGSFVRSWGNFVKSCHLPLQVVRTSIDHLKTTEFLTQESTRDYTLFSIPKYEHYQDLTKYSDSIILKSNTRSNTRLTTNNNRKKETPSSGRNGRRVAVVVEEKTEGLDRVAHGISMSLLESVKMAHPIASGLAAQKTVGQVLRVVQQARLQKKPGGWARLALEGDWTLPAAEGPELLEVLGLLRLAEQKRDAIFKTTLSREGICKRLPDEDENAWFRRVNDELKRRKECQKQSGRKSSKAT